MPHLRPFAAEVEGGGEMSFQAVAVSDCIKCEHNKFVIKSWGDDLPQQSCEHEGKLFIDHLGRCSGFKPHKGVT